MQPNSNNSQFVFCLPTDFVPDVLEYKYRKHLQNYHLPFETVVDYLNSSIKEFDMPSLTFQTVEQTTRYGKKIGYRGGGSPYDVYNNKLNITFRSINNHANYFIMRDCLMYHYINSSNIFVSPFLVYVLDFYYNENFIYTFKELIPTGLTDFKLAYHDQDNDEKIFSVTAIYNYLEIEYLLHDKPQLPPKKHL
jgi:hypothetical protein